MELLLLVMAMLVALDLLVSVNVTTGEAELRAYLASEYPTEFRFSEGLSVLHRTV
ncbi:hypothetical protein IJI72_02435 [Candidatus Saccharibacteria bacterium]|nr:hypothetical protein [Candidatus Saccharibacteria bacterium]